jgi:hypothetical protein
LIIYDNDYTFKLIFYEYDVIINLYNNGDNDNLSYVKYLLFVCKN